MKQRGQPYVDLLEAHRADFANFKGNLLGSRKVLGRHYNPTGNHFCAFALLPKLLDLLDPKPLPYRAETAVMK